MHILKSIMLFLISILFMSSLSVVIIGYASQPLLHPVTYTDAFETNEVYGEINQLLLENHIVSQAIRDQVINDLITNFLWYVQGEAQELNLTVTYPLEDELLKRINALPSCTNELLIQDAVCKPQGVDGQELMQIIMEDPSFATISQVDVGEIINQQGHVDRLREVIFYYQLIVQYAVLVSIVLFVLILLLTKSNFHQMTKWVDFDLFSVAFTLLMLTFAAQYAVQKFVPVMLHNILISIFLKSLQIIQIYSGIIIIIGVIFWGIDFAKQRKKK